MKLLAWNILGLVLIFLGGMAFAQDPDWSALGKAWWSHVEYLADDSLEGRDTGSAGFEKAAAYMADQFRMAGLQPAGVDGYRQPMDFDVVRFDESRSALALIRDGRVQPVRIGDDAILGVNPRAAERVEADAVFVGYGLTVPELDYDDLAGLAVRGKIVVFITGGPANMSGPIKAHYESSEERRKALVKAGVIGTISIGNPKAAEVPWSRIAASRFQPRMDLREPGPGAAPPLEMSVAFNPEHAEMLFAGSGHTFAEVLAAVNGEQPLPHFPLAVKVRAQLGMTRSQVRSENIAGLLPGSDPTLTDQYVVVSAHLDHLGVGAPVNGDRIYNGAMDDASGDASLIEIARAIRNSGTRPKRSILFLSVTGEEKGELGSEYFAAHPTVRGPIVADINMDMYLPLFPLKYLEVQGLGESTLGDDIRAVCAESGVQVQADKEPEHNRFIRSDQYSFIKKGVPSLAFKFGYIPGTPEEKIFKAWYAERYHAPSDDVNQPVDLAAAAQFNDILRKLALRVADAGQRPAWKPDSFFRRFAQQSSQ
ncbi:MAG TPA: M28 family metallopeptidase [Candidatus Cybelea sp.]|nr:M28 family metallopeptidase [Candidatus Cybelea sp.]